MDLHLFRKFKSNKHVFIVLNANSEKTLLLLLHQIIKLVLVPKIDLDYVNFNY